MEFGPINTLHVAESVTLKTKLTWKRNVAILLTKAGQDTANHFNISDASSKMSQILPLLSPNPQQFHNTFPK